MIKQVMRPARTPKYARNMENFFMKDVPGRRQDWELIMVAINFENHDPANNKLFQYQDLDCSG